MKIIENLIIMLKERKHYVEIKDLEIMNSQLERINQDLTNYGKEEKAEEKTHEDIEFID